MLVSCLARSAKPYRAFVPFSPKFEPTGPYTKANQVGYTRFSTMPWGGKFNLFNRFTISDPEFEKNIQKKMTESVSWFFDLRNKASYGDAKALYTISRLYKTGGDGLGKNEADSLEHLRSAAYKNYPPAIKDLAVHYLNSKHVENKDIAFTLLKTAVNIKPNEDLEFNRGIADAALILGMLYQERSCIPDDLNKAHGLLIRAQELGHPNAKEALAELEEKFRQRFHGLNPTNPSTLNE